MTDAGGDGEDFDGKLLLPPPHAARESSKIKGIADLNTRGSLIPTHNLNALYNTAKCRVENRENRRKPGSNRGFWAREVPILRF